jgi:hypothetical protein
MLSDSFHAIRWSECAVNANSIGLKLSLWRRCLQVTPHGGGWIFAGASKDL